MDLLNNFPIAVLYDGSKTAGNIGAGITTTNKVAATDVDYN